MDDDFVLCYIRANRMHEYRSQLHYEPDLKSIIINYEFDGDEWLAFVNKFKRRFLDLIFNAFKDDANFIVRRKHSHLIEKLNLEVISDLLDHGALSIHDAIDFLNILMPKNEYDDYVSMIVSYLLKKDVKIKAEWVARAINDGELVERIKVKHAFSFGEIHKAHKWNTNSPFDIMILKSFYTQLHKLFFNPNFAYKQNFKFIEKLLDK